MSAIGGMNHRLVLEEPVRIDDGAGGAAVSWAARATLWAAIEELTGVEQRAAARMSAEKRLRITMRPIDGIAPAQRLKLDQRIFDIVSVASREHERRIVCHCIERA